MKRAICLLLLILSVFLFASCSGEQSDDFFGTYRFKKAVYLSPLSSSMLEVFDSTMSGTEVTIEKDLFKILSREFLVELPNPHYIPIEKVEDEMFELSGNPFPLHELDGIYAVKDASGVDSSWRIYHTDSQLWIGETIPTPIGNKDYIMTVFEFEK
jgi:hypothetical protein